MRWFCVWSRCTRWSIDERVHPRFFKLKSIERRAFYDEST